MAKDASDFMLEEYTQVGKAFGDLYGVITRSFNFYLVILAVPFSVATIFYKNRGPGFELTKLPEPMPALALLIAAIGFFMGISMIQLRLEQLLYARTINCVRRYFAEMTPGIKNFLVLPITDLDPPFFEFGHFFFWQILCMGGLNGAFLAVGILNLLPKVPGWVAVAAWIVFLVAHFAMYGVVACWRQRRWNLRQAREPAFPGNF